MKNISYEKLLFKDFTESLQNIYNPPKSLYLAGVIPEGPKIAIVGMRKNTPYGEKVVKELVPNLVKAGFITVSGLAYGIDSLVHKYTIEAKGKTIAVLGSGLHCIYPQTNFGLALEIIKTGGGILSEYEPEVGPEIYHFPARNRIVAGLSEAVIVVEAAQKSGSLITASLALQEGRDVWVVPGRIDVESSKGTNSLLQSGAIPFLDINQFLSYYKLSVKKQTPTEYEISPNAQLLLNQITQHEGFPVDKYLQLIKLDMSSLNIFITELELNKLIINKDGKLYIL